MYSLLGLDDSVKDLYVYVDPGGDLGGCTAIVDLFESAGHKVEVTAPDSSHMNGPVVERPHQNVAMLCGANLRPGRVLALLFPPLHPLVQCYSTQR